MYLMTCKKSSSKCKQYHVTGFPTILLFRSIQSEHRDCIPIDLVLEPTWVDYHGVFEVFFFICLEIILAASATSLSA